MADQPSIEILVETDTELDFPSLWGVRFLNDDFTPMDFVIMLMMQVFKLSYEESEATTVKIHNDGEAVIGAYPKDIAETKAIMAEQCAREYGHPLRLDAVEI